MGYSIKLWNEKGYIKVSCWKEKLDDSLISDFFNISNLECGIILYVHLTGQTFEVIGLWTGSTRYWSDICNFNVCVLFRHGTSPTFVLFRHGTSPTIVLFRHGTSPTIAISTFLLFWRSTTMFVPNESLKKK